MGFIDSVRYNLDAEKFYAKMFRGEAEKCRRAKERKLLAMGVDKDLLRDAVLETSLNGKGRRQFYVKTRSDRKYLGKNSEELINLFKLERLLEGLVYVHSFNAKLLSKVAECFLSDDLESVMADLPKTYRGSFKSHGSDDVKDVAKDAQELLDEWMLKKRGNGEGVRFTQSQNKFHPEELRHKTSFGLIVRSRVEAAFAEQLYNEGWIIFYEKELWLINENGNVEKVYPDFIVVRRLDAPRSEWIYIEHLGQMENESYRERNFYKLWLYFQNGIIVGKNFFLSMDGMGATMDLGNIKRIVRSLELV